MLPGFYPKFYGKTAKQTKVDIAWQVIPCIYDALAEELSAYTAEHRFLYSINLCPGGYLKQSWDKIAIFSN